MDRKWQCSICGLKVAWSWKNQSTAHVIRKFEVSGRKSDLHYKQEDWVDLLGGMTETGTYTRKKKIPLNDRFFPVYPLFPYACQILSYG